MHGASRPTARLLVVVALVWCAVAGMVVAGRIPRPELTASPPDRSDAPAVQRGPQTVEPLGGLVIRAPATRAKPSETGPVGLPVRVLPPLGALLALAVAWLIVDHADRRPSIEHPSRSRGSRAPPSWLAAA